MTKVISLRKKRLKYSKSEPQKKTKYKRGFLSEKNRIFLLVIAVVSILMGCLTYKFFKIDFITTEVLNAFTLFQCSNWLKIFLYFIECDLIFMLIAFFVGTSFLGSLISSLPLILKSMLIGYQGTAIYNEYALKGVLFCLVLLYPCYVITTTALIYACDESNYMSKSIYNLAINQNTANGINVKLYLVRYLILTVISVACIAVNSLLVCMLAPKITLV